MSNEGTDRPGGQANEGEGNRTAARRYNKAQAEFAKSGKVDDAAEEAKQALDDSEQREELESAEEEGRSHARAEDPAVREKKTGSKSDGKAR